MLNLIPDSVCRRATLRKSALRWAVLCTAVGVAGLALRAPVWWNVRGLRAAVDRAEGDCREVRRLIADGERLRRRHETATNRDRRYSFAEHFHIPLSVVGVLSREARSLKGRLWIDDFDFSEYVETTVDSSGISRRRIVVSLSGVALRDSAISSLISSLRRSDYFAEVELKSTRNAGGGASEGRRFQITCVLFVDTKFA